MKLEEAIAKAKILNDSLKELTDEYEGQGSFIAAGMAVSFKLVLDTILSALRPVSREQVEKVWRGVWKHYLPPLGAGNIQCRCTKCGRTPDVETPFCAWCGAPMTDEAVEMVMEKINNMEEMTNEH